MHIHEFERFADNYAENNDIQRIVASKLLSYLSIDTPINVLDVGCGDGAIFKTGCLPYRTYVGMDASRRMCELHPQGDGVYLEYADFDAPSSFSSLATKYGHFDLFVSSSALQWSRDLTSLLARASSLAPRFAVSIFCSGTFQNIREFLKIPGFLPTSEALCTQFSTFSLSTCAVERYIKRFDNSQEALRYIKHTGVSGGKRSIGYRETKKLYECGPSELEFEVAYFVGSFEKTFFSIA